MEQEDAKAQRKAVVGNTMAEDHQHLVLVAGFQFLPGAFMSWW